MLAPSFGHSLTTTDGGAPLSPHLSSCSSATRFWKKRGLWRVTMSLLEYRAPYPLTVLAPSGVARLLPKRAKGREQGGRDEGTGGKKVLSGRHLVGPAAQHRCRDAGHNRMRLDVEVSVEFVGAPAADHANAVLADASAKEGHGAARPG